jgi:hypothetical protein
LHCRRHMFQSTRLLASEFGYALLENWRQRVGGKNRYESGSSAHPQLERTHTTEKKTSFIIRAFGAGQTVCCVARDACDRRTNLQCHILIMSCASVFVFGARNLTRAWGKWKKALANLFVVPVRIIRFYLWYSGAAALVPLNYLSYIIDFLKIFAAN